MEKKKSVRVKLRLVLPYDAQNKLKFYIQSKLSFLQNVICQLNDNV